MQNILILWTGPRHSGKSTSVASLAQIARDEGFDEVADWFETLAKTERSHANRFQKALDNLDA